jgi:hypothetical protein
VVAVPVAVAEDSSSPSFQDHLGPSKKMLHKYSWYTVNRNNNKHRVTIQWKQREFTTLFGLSQVNQKNPSRLSCVGQVLRGLVQKIRGLPVPVDKGTKTDDVCKSS